MPEQQTNPEQEVYLGRQPIFDTELNVFAYELLFRTDVEGGCQITDQEEATRSVILNTFAEIGLEKVVGRHSAFLNMSEAMLHEPLPLPEDRVILEILEHVEPNEKVIKSCQKLVDMGFKLALDDFEYDQRFIPLLDICEYVKVDVRAMSMEDVKKTAELVSKHNVKLLAEKVETNEEFEQCKEMGFELFQGYFLSKPNVMAGKKTSADKLTVSRLLAELRKPENQVKEIEKLIASDPKLSFKLLQIINSAAYVKSNAIESISQAIVYMGLEKLKQWASIIAMSSVESRSPELMITAMVRAKMCELLAQKLYPGEKVDRYFTVGLFSLLDAILEQEMRSLVEQINLDDEASSALLEHNGHLGEVVKDVLAYEHAKWEELDVEHLRAGTYREAYLESINWAMDTTKAIGA